MLAIVTVVTLMRASFTLAFEGEEAAYDAAPPNLDPVEHAVAEKYRASLMDIHGVSLVYVANDGYIVVRVKKITPELAERIPKELNGCPVKLVGVEDVMQRHLHELFQIAGESEVFGYSVETLPDGQLAIVVRVRRPRQDEAVKVPNNIEGIPFRVLAAQEPLTG
jgi:hypothetical protein